MPPVQGPHRMVTRSELKNKKDNAALQRQGKKNIPKRTAKSSVLQHNKSTHRRTFPAKKKLLVRAVPAKKKPPVRTVPAKKKLARTASARQPKKQKVEKCGEIRYSKMEINNKNLRLKNAELRKENASLKKQLSVFEEWRKSNAILKLQNAVLQVAPSQVKDVDLFQMIESGMDGDQIEAELKLGFPPLHGIWNEFNYLKKHVLDFSSETNDKETSETLKPEDGNKEPDLKCAKKMEQKKVLQEEYDKLKEKLDQYKQESDSSLRTKTDIRNAIKKKIRRSQQREVEDQKEIEKLEKIIPKNIEKREELESKLQDAKRQFAVLDAECSEKKAEHASFKTNAEKCKMCDKLKQDYKAAQTEWKGNCARKKATLKDLNEVHKKCADGCRQGRMLISELKFLKEKIDCAKQQYYGDSFLAESGRIYLQECAGRLKGEQHDIETLYRECLAKCGVPIAPLSSSSSSSLSTTSSQEEAFQAWREQLDDDSDSVIETDSST